MGARWYGIKDALRRKLFPRLEPRASGFIAEQKSLAKSLAGRFTHAIVHAGLSAVDAASAREAADAIFQELSSSLSFFVCPAYTPSFRKSRVFSIPDSQPEVGGFSKMCMERKPPRTIDPIHSLFVFGKTGAELLSDPVRDTFAPDGVFKHFSDPGSCWINIGTPQLVSTVLHYVERLACVPYTREETLAGHFFYSDNRKEEVRQTSYRRVFRVAWNREKIENFLISFGAAEKFLWRGAVVRVVDGNLAVKLLMRELSGNPYFMVTP